MSEYKVTDEAIGAIVKECPQSRGALKAAFPEAFKEKWALVDPARIDIAPYKGEGYIEIYLSVDGKEIGRIPGRPDAEEASLHDGYRVRAENGVRYDAMFWVYERVLL